MRIPHMSLVTSLLTTTFVTGSLMLASPAAAANASVDPLTTAYVNPGGTAVSWGADIVCPQGETYTLEPFVAQRDPVAIPELATEDSGIPASMDPVRGNCTGTTQQLRFTLTVQDTTYVDAETNQTVTEFVPMSPTGPTHTSAQIVLRTATSSALYCAAPNCAEATGPYITLAASPPQMISESFGSSAVNFTRVSGGTWSVSSGRYVLTAPATTAVPNANLSVHNTTVTGDFTLTASGSTTPTTAAFNDFSMVFGYRDPANYSYASFNEGNDSSTNGIFRVSGGVATQLVDITSTIAAGTMYPIRVERQGTTVRVFRGGTLVATTTDASFSSGRVGFGTKNDGATFDDLVVTGTAASRAPSAPTGVAAAAGNTSATVNWVAPTDAGSSAITGYRVRRYVGSSTTVQATTTVAATARSLTATGLTNGSSYSFDVAAINSAGTGTVSSRSTAVTPTATTTTVVGNQTVGTKWTPATGDSKRASRFSATTTVAATRVRAYLDGNSGTTGSQSLRAVIYTDTSGAPATRLTSSASVTIAAGRAAGWVTFTLPATVTLNVNTAYWIGLHSGPNKVARFAGTTATSALRLNSDTYGDGAASSFGTASTDTTRMSIYASSN